MTAIHMTDHAVLVPGGGLFSKYSFITELNNELKIADKIADKIAEAPGE